MTEHHATGVQGYLEAIRAVLARQWREWSSSQSQSSMSVQSTSDQWVVSVCQCSLRGTASKRMYELLGRL